MSGLKCRVQLPSVWKSMTIGRKVQWLERQTQLNFSFSAMEIARFTIGAQRTDHNVKDAKDKLVISMCAALHINPSEICLGESEEVGDNWFNLTFEIPNRREVLDTLRWAAIHKDPWLGLCGVKAVTIGRESQILMQPITRSLSLTIPAGELSH